LLKYLNRHSIPENKIKVLRLLSDILFSLSNKNPDVLEFFEAYVRMRDKYLRLVYKEDVYCEAAIKSLKGCDSFVFFAARAYALKDMYDIVGFVKNLRFALQCFPSAKDTISLICERIDLSNITELKPRLNTSVAKQIFNLFEAINEAQSAKQYGDCQEAALALCDFIDENAGEGTQAVKLLENYCEILFKAHNGEIDENSLQEHFDKIESDVKDELQMATPENPLRRISNVANASTRV
jgi:hypothetical protein